MLNGPLLGKIFLFALPLAAASMLQQALNAADIAVVGNFAGNESMAAVGANSSIISLFINLCIGISVGANVVISSWIGRQNEKKVKEAEKTAYTVAIIIGFLLLVLGEIFAPMILNVMGTPPELMERATIYLRIYFLGVPFIAMFNVGAAILRSCGDTKRPLYALISAGVLNIILNVLFVVAFQMDVVGVAVATDIANGLNAFLVLWFLSHDKGTMRLNLREFEIKGEYLVPILKIGLPAALQGMLFSISNLFIQSGVNAYGPSAMSAHTIGCNFDLLVFYLINSFGSAAVTFLSQNFAAGKKERCWSVIKQVYITCFITTFTLNMIFGFGTKFFYGLFTKESEVIYYGLIRMRWVHQIQCLVSTYEVTAATMRGLGHSMTPSMVILVGTCLFRMAYITFFYPTMQSFLVLMLCYPISWVITGTAMNLACFRIAKKELG